MILQRFDEGISKLDALVDFSKTCLKTRNEATTRLHLIDRLFFECLGWDRADCEAEESSDGEFSDYTFSVSNRVLIVEAKREGAYFDLPAGASFGVAPIRGLTGGNRKLESAMKQVARYCQKRGVAVAAVTNGHQLVAFIAVRTDGQPPMQGKAIVFPSLESMKDNFKDLWDSLSRPGVTEKRLRDKLLGSPGAPLPPRLASSISSYPGTKKRNVFQTDLQIVAELVLEDLARIPESEEVFLRECYAKSGALSQYALLSKEVLRARYASLEGSTEAPTLVPAVDKKARISSELVADSLSRRPILLIGDVGVGKTTFIRNLIKIEAKEVFEDAITIYLDLGSRAALTSDIRDYFVTDVTRQLRVNYGIDVDESSFVRGVYHSELARFRRGIYGELAESAPAKFREKELSFLEELVQASDKHLAASISHLERARRQQIVIFIDNADQREDQTQQNAFFMAQEIADSWPATVFLSLRPETFYRSLSAGALTGYHPKAFSISPPRIDKVIARRLRFGIKLASGEVDVQGLPPGIGVKFRSLTSIIQVFMDSLDRQEDLMEAIDNISSGNIRRGLDLVREFFGSGHVDTAKIVQIYDDSGSYYIPLHEFMRAVILGDHAYFAPDRSPIANLFEIGSSDGREHFLLPIVLQAMTVLVKTGKQGFVQRGQVVEHCQGLGFLADQIDYALSRGFDKELLEKGHSPRGADEESYRLTSKGAYHLWRLLGSFFYLDLMVVDTPILDDAVRALVSDAHSIEERLRRGIQFIEYLDEQWNESNLPPEALSWEGISARVRREIQQVATKIGLPSN